MEMKTLVLLATFAFYFADTSSSLSDQKKSELKKFKFPACQSCKILAKSFQDGMERTSRGKLEGGDTAWEEENKLSYARSEIRLIEIEEKLCSGIEKGLHQCQSLAEENENLFEEWWKDQDKLGDLQKWLCVDKLEVCCLENHYGPDCTPCTGYPDTICSNNGKCKGSGTRKGNGQCSCNVGYEGDTCEKCGTGYFEAYKDDTKLLCSSCHKSCEHSCTQAGPRGCIACKPGWQMNSELGCVDTNECITIINACTPRHFCVNNEGSYACLQCDKACARCDGDGPDMCLECADEYYLNGNVCEDSRKQARERSLSLTRYGTYIGLCIATCIVFQRNTYVASLIGLAVALYISTSEYMIHTEKANNDLSYNLGNIFTPV